jgi:hypothetical protein
MVAWCPTLYLLTMLLAGAGIKAMLDSADGLEVLILIPVALVLFGVSGHIAFGIAVAMLIPAPRRRARLVLLPFGTFGCTCAIAMSRTLPEIVAFATVAVPAALGYWAAAPLPTTTEIAAPRDQVAPVGAP